MVEVTPFCSLIDAISFRKQRDPQGQAFVFLSGDGQAQTVTNEQFYNDMQRYAFGLAAKGVQQGEIVLLALDHDYEMVACFWGTICCGAIPSVLTYWHPGSDMDVYVRKVERLAAAVGARAVITQPKLYSSITAVLAKIGCLAFMAQEIAETLPDTFLALPELDAEQIALMQFTSGTTSQPKAIQFSHRSVLDHVAVSASAYQMTRDYVYVSWLPFYHDMGLIGHIRSLIHGGLLVTMAPQTWLRQPEMLLKAIHQYRGTMANMPNFSFDYCTQRIHDDDLVGVDLRCWRVLSNGSEQVMPTSMQRFSERFAPYGFRAEALAVGYGMAENVMGISATPPGQGLRIDWVSADGLHSQNRAIPVDASSAGARAVASCGYPYRGIDLAIVDDQWAQLAEREVGEITIRSNTLFTGYYLAPEANEGIFQKGWFRTGDLGYVADGQLYVCDRKKDLIIVGGRNVHPQAIENIAVSVFGKSVGRCAAFGLSNPRLGTEMPVLVIELRKQIDDVQVQQIIRRVRKQVADELDILLADVRLVPKGWVEKTTSGKVARAASRKKYLDEDQPEEDKFLPDELTFAQLELIIARLFKSVLGVDDIGPNDDFIKRGGDSLSALRLFLEIEQRFGQDVSAAEFFQQPTIEHLAVILYRQVGEKAVVKMKTPPSLGKIERPLHFEIKKQLPLLNHGGVKKIEGVLRQKALDFTYKAKLSFLTWLYGQEWAQQIFKQDIICSARRFYALLEKPLQTKKEVIQFELIFKNPGEIQKQLLDKIFSHKPGCWALQVDMTPLELAYQRGRGVIMVMGHTKFTHLVKEFTIGSLRPNDFTIIGKVASLLPEGAEALTPQERRRLRLSILLDQLLDSRRTLTRGGIVLVLPDGQDGLSRGISFPFHSRMRDFKAGFAELAIETGAAVIPVSLAMDVRKRQVTLLFLDPLDIGLADMAQTVRVEGLVRQYVAYLKEEWNCCPGMVGLEQKRKHLNAPPRGDGIYLSDREVLSQLERKNEKPDKAFA